MQPKVDQKNEAQTPADSDLRAPTPLTPEEMVSDVAPTLHGTPPAQGKPGSRVESYNQGVPSPFEKEQAEGDPDVIDEALRNQEASQKRESEEGSGQAAA